VSYRSRGYHGRRGSPWFAGSAVAAGLLAAGLQGSHAGAASARASDRAAATAVAFVRAQAGAVPYVWGGTTTAGFDCSGLVQAAYAAAGVSIERTSEEQWVSEPHVAAPVAGDLVFFAGADGTPSSPGHVGIVTDPARHLMIDAYAAGTYVRYDTYGLASSAPGLSDPVGFTDPAGARDGWRPAPAAGCVRYRAGCSFRDRCCRGRQHRRSRAIRDRARRWSLAATPGREAPVMGTRAALVSGTVLSLAAVSAWSLTATATIGTARPVHLSRDLPGDYAALADGATGNGLALFAVTAVIYALCFLVSGLRARARAQREVADLPGFTEAAEPVSGRFR
jgi:NlpC/P60 family